MPPEVLAKAFDPFFTTKDVGKGTGLGLSQVFGFVKQSGGHVKIYSEPGRERRSRSICRATTVSEAERAPAEVPVDAELKGAESILLVEDDANVLALTSAGLRDLGYTVFEASHANDAMEHLLNGARVDLMLTDIVMPDTTAASLRRRRRPSVPI